METKGKVIIIVVICIVGFLIVGNTISIIWPQQEKQLLTRSEAIPSDAVKVTPSTDEHPPQLTAAFKSMFNDPVLMPGPVNTAGAEDSPFMTPDGKTFFFWFCPDVKSAGESINDGSTGIYSTTLSGTTWSEPKRVFTGWDVLDGCPTYYNNQLYFCSARPGSELQMYVGDFNGVNATNIVKLSDYLDKSYPIGEMHIADSGNKIYYGTREEDSMDYNIYYTEKSGGEWQEPVALSTINTDQAENMPFVSEDGKELWYCYAPINGDSYGPPFVYRSVWTGSGWGAPERVLESLAGEPTLDNAGNLYFVHHYWDDATNSMLEADIYVCYRK